ncbi:MAG: outer membrane beta-barrel protein [Candidatus Tenebribacter mawsonii]|nr:outer membrane beta-barrel protein [Candidatus Tenebribacter mawsonii]
MKFKIFVIALMIFPIICFGYDFENGGVRNAALGGTGIASSRDASTAVWNPAGLVGFRYFQLITDSRPYMIQMDNDEIAQNFVYLSFPINKIPGAFALTGSSFNSDAFTEGRYGLHYGAGIFPNKFPGKFSIGLSLLDHYTSFSEINESKNAFDLDLGISYRLNKYADFGLLVGNLLQADMAINNDNEDKLPMRLGFGSDFTWKRIVISGDILLRKHQSYNELGFGIGFEYILAKNLQLRMGLNNHDLTGGFGVNFYSKKWFEPTGNKNEKIDFSFLQISMDYAFQYPLSEASESGIVSIGNSLESDYGEHFFGIKIDFGKNRDLDKDFVSLFPSQFGVDLDVSVDTVFIEKVVIDTIVQTRTIHDTIRIIERVMDEREVEKKVQEEASKIRKSDIEKINQASVHLIAALEFYYSEEYYKAIDECNRAISLAPDLSLSYIRLASIYYRLGDVEEAMYQLKHAERIDPNNAEIKKMMRLLLNE